MRHLPSSKFPFFLETRIPYIAKAGLALPNDFAVSASESWERTTQHSLDLFLFFFGGGQCVYFQNGNFPLEHTGIIMLESILLREKTDTSWLLRSSSVTSMESLKLKWMQ